jgi:N6-adenosine-specific RNA methylase IME4
MKFAAIIADPPWPYDSPRAIVGNGGRGSDGGRAAEIIQADVGQHYETMTLDNIKALDVPAAADALLFMWVTNPFLADGSGADVVRAWGFTPKTVLTWAKVQADGKTPSMKTGHWFRSASEHVIFATKGKVRRPEGFPALPTWQPHARMPHSVKPEYLYSYAEMAMPEGMWLEMFARRERAGWHSWGNEIQSTVQIAAE